MTWQDRFMSKVQLSLFCWKWTAGRNADGYGYFWLEGQNCRAPRLAYELFVGPIPADHVIDHICRNRGCVNPAHLEVVTAKVNTLRGTNPPARNARKTKCLRGHWYDYFPPDGSRACLTCYREVYAPRRQKKAKLLTAQRKRSRILASATESQDTET